MSKPEHVVNWRIRTKLKLVAYKGGKCERCGYDKPCPNAFAFHHRDPSEKLFTISGKSLAFEKLQREADKCDLLCRNCHAETHDKEFAERRDKTVKKWHARIKRAIKPVACQYCRKTFKPVTRRRKFCSQECCFASAKKCERPSKLELSSMIKNMSYCAIGRQFGVSDNAVRKWARKYGLIK